MFLTEAQLHELQQIIDDHHAAFVANNVSPGAIPPETLERLKKLGLINVTAETLRDIYRFGLISTAAERAEAQKMTYQQFKQSLKTNPAPLSAAENQAVIVANLRAGQYIRGLGVKVAQVVGQGVINADAQVRQDIKEDVRTLTQQAVATRRSLKELGSDIGHATQDWTRDLARIANTEVQDAMQVGVADALVKERGDPDVVRLASPDCCFIAGTTVMTRGGLKPIQAIAVGEEVLTHRLRWRPVTAVFCRSYTGDLYGFNGRPAAATSSHPFLVNYEWTDAQAVKPGDQIVVVGGARNAKDQPPQASQRGLSQGIAIPHFAGAVPVPTVDLYRNLLLRKPDVHVKWADCQLDNGSTASEALRQCNGFRRCIDALLLPCQSSLGSAFGALHALRCAASTLCNLLPLFERQLSVANSVAFVGCSHRHTGFFEAAFNQTHGTFELLRHSESGLFLNGVGIRNGGGVDVLAASMQSAHIAAIEFVTEIVKQEAASPVLVYNLEVKEDESYVADGVIVHNCPTCFRLYKWPDGRPRVFKLSELIRNGSNVGRKQEDWLPVANCTHPNCRCGTQVVPEGMEYNRRGLPVPKRGFTLERAMDGRTRNAADLLWKADG